MPFDEGVANRVRAALSRRKTISEKRMFGGLAFLLNGNMCCGVVRDVLVLRLGESGTADALREPHVRPMDFTGTPMKSMVYLDPVGFATEAELRAWLTRAIKFAGSLPAKT